MATQLLTRAILLKEDLDITMDIFNTAMIMTLATRKAWGDLMEQVTVGGCYNMLSFRKKCTDSFEECDE